MSTRTIPKIIWPVLTRSKIPSWSSITRQLSTAHGMDLETFRAALGLAMTLHSGQEEHAFLETVSSSTPTFVTISCPFDVSVDKIFRSSQTLSLGDNDNVYGSAVHLVVRSSEEVPELSTDIGSPLQIEVLDASVRVRFDTSTIQNSFDVSAFFDHLARIIEIISSGAKAQVSDVLRQLSEFDKEQTLSFSVGRQQKELLAHERIEKIARSSPSAIALDFENTSVMTYAELDSRASALAAVLQAEGVVPDVMIPIMFNVSFDMIIAVVAVLKAGGAYVPLAPDYPTARWESIINSTGSSFLLCGSDLASQSEVEELKKSLPSLRVISYSHENFTVPIASFKSPSSLTAANLAYVFFTSGSTGIPKGVGVEHGNLRAFLDSGEGNAIAGAGTRKLLFASYTFDISVGDIFSVLTTGATLGLVRRGELFSNMLHWLDVMKPTHLGITPSIARQIPVEGFPHLKHIILNGETLPVDLALKLSATRQLYNVMGPTEATIDATAYIVPMNSGLDNTNPFGERVPIGYPTGQTKIYIFRVGTLDLAVRGEVGEICIGGPQVARGYIGRDDLNVVKFVRDPFGGEGDRIFRSGDLGRWNQLGQLDHLGRIDGQVKLRGMRIETGEVETIAQKANPEVIGAVYVDVVRTAGEQALVGAFTLKAHKELNNPGSPSWTLNIHTADEVKDLQRDINEACRKYLSPYMRPSTWFCVAEFPTTLSGKTDRARLRRKIEEVLSQNTPISTPPLSTPEPDEGNVSVVSLTKLVSEVLHTPVVEVDLELSFLSLGGTSIQGMVFSSALRSRGVKSSIVDILDDRISLRTLFHSLIDSSTEAATQAIPPYKPFATAPPDWKDGLVTVDLAEEDVEDVHILDDMVKDWVKLSTKSMSRGKCLMMHFQYDLGGDLDHEKFMWCWEELRLREPSLRTVVADVRAGKVGREDTTQDYYAFVLRPEGKDRLPPLQVYRAADDKETQALAKKLFDEHTFEFGVVPTLNFLIFNEADKKWVYGQSRPHAFYDARTLLIQAGELTQIYGNGKKALEMIAKGRTIETSYASYVHTIHHPSQEAVGRQFWMKYLEELPGPSSWPSPSQVPLSYCHPDASVFAEYFNQLPGDLTAVANKTGVTKASLIRTAFAVAMAEKQDRDEVIMFEVVDGLSGLPMSPYGYCVHFQPTRLPAPPALEGESNAERYARMARLCHRSFSQTMPHRASGWEMGKEVLPKAEKGARHYYTSVVNIMDNTGMAAAMASNPPPALQLQLSVPAKFSYSGVDTPFALQAFISEQATVYMVIYDTSVVSAEETDRFVKRQMEVLSELASFA